MQALLCCVHAKQAAGVTTVLTTLLSRTLIQTWLLCRQPVLLQSASASLPSFTGQSVAAGIQGRVSFARGNRHRSLDISLEYAALGPDGRLCGDTEALMYDMASE